MAKSIYALLVGIDKYHPESNISSLQGCVNDIKEVEAYLRNRIHQDGEWKLIEPNNQPWILTNEQATRQAIISGFEQHLCQAESDDVVLFYYAGHGAQEKAPEVFWSLEPDRLNESIVCYDSRTTNVPDLADKELAYLISKVGQNNPHVLIILDCCHSGSGTRDLSPNVKVRRAPVDSRERSIDSYVFGNDKTVIEQFLNSPDDQKKKTTGIVLPQGRHVMFSACHDYELAKEYKDDEGQSRGVFSYFLLQILKRTHGNITYRDLARSINALVSGKVKEQSPQVDATDSTELDKPFLGGAIGERALYFSLTYSENDQTWVIDGGALHGIKPTKVGETLLAIFPLASTNEDLRNLDASLGEAKLTKVLPQKSKVEIICGEEHLAENELYKAVVTSLPLPPLKIFLQIDESDTAGIQILQEALQKAAPGEKPSLYLCQVEQAANADYYLVARDNQYWIIYPEDGRPVIAPIPENSNKAGYTPEIASQVVIRLEHIARWENILELSTPASSRIQQDDVEMEIIASGRNFSGSEMRLDYASENGEEQYPNIQIKLTNNSNKTLYVNVLILAENFAVELPFFNQKSSIRLAPQVSQEMTTILSEELTFGIPEEFVKQGITEYKDIFKLIASPTEFNAALLEQDGLNPPPYTRSLEDKGTLNRLLNGVNTRNAVKAKGTYDDWMTKEVTITFVRQQDAKAIKSNSSTLLQNDLVEVQSHPSLRAKVNLTTVPQASRDLGNLILPALLRQQPRVTQSFEFTTSRGSDPGLSALELTEVENHQVVTQKAPLKLLVDKELADNEYLLPFAYDSEDEFFLPLGRGKRTDNGKTEIVLERLPKPTSSSRSLRGSIKIFFEKVAYQKLGRQYRYPRLRAVKEVGKNDLVIYEENQETIKELVSKARKIVLYIHGIIGDTESMIPSINKATVEMHGQKRSLKEVYDLVLAFDYENIHTTIEENGRLLGQRLQEVGLRPNHGKELHIVAYCTGGLVSRWFIEREGGNQVVQHLVMLGTPNAGTPWSAVQDLVFAVLGMGLNQLSTIIWSTNVVAELLEFLEADDYSLDQIQPDSSLLRKLASHPDPHVPYTIIAGNRSLMPKVIEVKSGHQSSILQRLMQKLFGKAVDNVVDLAFFKQPNDIVVSLSSIESVSSNRNPQPRMLHPYAACDHFTYFIHPAGLQVLSQALFPSSSFNGTNAQQYSVTDAVAFAYRELATPNLPNTKSHWSGRYVEPVTTIFLPNQSQNTSPNPSEQVQKEKLTDAVNSSDTAIQSTQNRSRIKGVLIGFIVLLVVAAVGYVLWNRSPKEEPAYQNDSNQTVPVE